MKPGGRAKDRLQPQTSRSMPFRSGDFSALQNGYVANGRFVSPILIYDPDTGVPFPNNVIPASRIHPGALNVLDTYVPHAQFVQSDIQDFTARASVPTPTNVNTYFARVDHNINDNNRVFARLAWDRSNLTRSNINPFLPVFVSLQGDEPGDPVDPYIRSEQNPGSSFRIQYLRRPYFESPDRQL